MSCIVVALVIWLHKMLSSHCINSVLSVVLLKYVLLLLLLLHEKYKLLRQVELVLKITMPNLNSIAGWWRGRMDGIIHFF